MYYSSAFASVFGPLLIIMGIWTIFYLENVKQVAHSFFKTPALLYLGGLINLLIGLTTIYCCNVWEMSLALLVTLLGWVMFIRGLCIFFFPKMIHKLSQLQERSYIYFGIVSLIWGLALSWFAFMGL